MPAKQRMGNALRSLSALSNIAADHLARSKLLAKPTYARVTAGPALPVMMGQFVHAALLRFATAPSVAKPAAHRRLRKQRSLALDLLRLGAAPRLVATHLNNHLRSRSVAPKGTRPNPNSC